MSNVLTNQKIKDTYQKLLLWETLDGTEITEVCDALGNTYTISGGGGDAYATDIGNGASTTFVINHGFGTKDVIVDVYSNLNPYSVDEPDIRKTSANSVTIDFGASVPAANEYRVAIFGSAGTPLTESSPLTTKGDIYTFSTINTRLALGTVGQVLTVNPLTVTGLEWQDAAGGDPYFISNFAGNVPTIAGTNIQNNIAVGEDVNITYGHDNVAIGRKITISQGVGLGLKDSGNVAIGYYTSIQGNASVVIGYRAQTSQESSRNVILGAQAYLGPNSSRNVLIGYGAYAGAGSSSNSTIVIGYGSGGSADNSIMIGFGASAKSGTAGERCVAIGQGATMSFCEDTVRLGNFGNISYYSDRSIALGTSASIFGVTNAISLGYNTSNSGNSSISIGDSASTSGSWTTAIGPQANVNSLNGIALGYKTNSTTGARQIVIGPNSQATAENGVTIGNFASAGDGLSSIAIGNNTGCANGTTQCIAIGSIARADSSLSIAIGQLADVAPAAAAIGGIAIGSQSDVFLTKGMAIGFDATSNNAYGVAIGYNAAQTGTSSIAIGQGAASNAPYGVAIGPGSLSLEKSVAIGSSAGTGYSKAVSIGYNASTGGRSMVAIGYQANGGPGGSLGYSNTTAVGSFTSCAQFEATAIGYAAVCNAQNSVQLNTGTNTTTSTAQFLQNIFADANGVVIPTHTGPGSPGYTPQQGGISFDTVTATLWIYDGALWKNLPTAFV